MLRNLHSIRKTVSTMSTNSLVWILISSLGIVITVCIYCYHSNGMRFSDDFGFTYENYCRTLWEPFYKKTESMNDAFAHAYRPIEAVVYILIRRLAGDAVWPIHCVNLALFLFTSWIYYSFLVRIGVNKITSYVAATIFICSQAAVHACYSLDTVSQILSTLFGLLSNMILLQRLLYLLRNKNDVSVPPHTLMYAGLLQVLSIFSKEIGFSFVAINMILLFALFFLLFNRSHHKALVTGIGWILFSSCCLVVYFWIRNKLGFKPVQTGDDSYYSIQFGFNIIKNVVLSIFQSVSPIASSSLFLALKNHNYLKLAFFVTILLISSSYLLNLLQNCKREKIRYYLFFLVLFIASSSSFILLSHVGELYVYAMLPFSSLAISIGVTQAVTNKKKYLFLAIYLTIIGSNIFSVAIKTSQMDKNGFIASNLLDQIITEGKKNNDVTTFVFCNREPISHEYSIFAMHDFNVLKFGAEGHISYKLGRTVNINIINESMLDRLSPKLKFPILIFTTKDDRGTCSSKKIAEAW